MLDRVCDVIEDGACAEVRMRGEDEMYECLTDILDNPGITPEERAEQLAGHGHASGDFIKLDNVFDVIHRNSHEYYTVESDERMQLFFQILMSREMTPEERADILMNGTVRIG